MGVRIANSGQEMVGSGRRKKKERKRKERSAGFAVLRTGLLA